MNFYTCTSVGIVAITAASLVGSAVAQDKPSPLDRAEKSVNTRNASSKIVGGGPVDTDKYSFQVALISSKSDKGFEFFGQFCGSSLIADRWVMTAAHCVDTASPTEIDTLIGARVLPDNGVERGDRIAIDAIIVHPAYDPTTNDNDIALLHLTEDAPKDVKRVALPTAALQTQYGHDDADALVIGWGRTAEGGSSSATLMRVLVDVKNRAVCEANYQAASPSITITENMFCAGVEGGGKDSCQGDSGGFIGASHGGGDYVQTGIVSWGFGCARPGLYGVYTLVANYSDWVADEMKNF